jgi:chaperonin cofactor prefoldin
MNIKETINNLDNLIKDETINIDIGKLITKSKKNKLT